MSGGKKKDRIFIFIGDSRGTKDTGILDGMTVYTAIWINWDIIIQVK
jgi:hypothetical protein